MKRLSLIITLLLIFSLCKGAVKLPAILSSHMVLQQMTTVKLWGNSNKKQVKIHTSWNNKTYKARTDNTGDWEIEIETQKAGGPYTITFNDGDIIKLEDIYLGEVWFCSGQSNMEMPVKGFNGQPVLHSTETICEANTDIPIRLFTVERNPSKHIENDNYTGSWETNEPENAANFSAVAYFFGKQLYNSLNIPIGLIHSSWGASNIQAWMSSESLNKFPEISQEHLKSQNKVEKPNQAASMLYNGMVYPYRNLKIKGIIWYQGESNRNEPEQYISLFKSFTEDWRKLFRNNQLPFYFVQIAPFKYEGNEKVSSAIFREAQCICEKENENVKMAVTMDLGDEFCIHPARKKEVGERLAYLALNHTYQKYGIPSEAPSFKNQEIKGNRIILNFDKAELGLTSYNKPFNLFEIAGEDGVFHPAKARIINHRQVEVWNEQINAPVTVRYAFKNYTEGELFGTNGIPVSSFRTNINF